MGSSRDLQQWEPSGADSGFCCGNMQFLLLFLLALCGAMTWMKQYPRLPGSLPPWREKETWWSAELVGELEKLEVEGSFSEAMKANPWIPKGRCGPLVSSEDALQKKVK